jgi:DNA-binding response OmpR family regulator
MMNRNGIHIAFQASELDHGHQPLKHYKMKPSPHILVIDDENYICESCNRIFANAGYRVDTNISATSGFRQALTNPYDAIILDLNLIEADGMKLLYGIRKRKPDVPVVIITGYPSEDTRRMSTTLGVTDYITKPFEPAELLEPVQRVISSESESLTEYEARLGQKIEESRYQFYQSSWFYRLANGSIRVGGYLPDLANSYVKAIKLPEIGSSIYRGLPLAEVTLSNGTKKIIPSSVSGKVRLVNKQLKEHVYNLEKNIHRKSWIAVLEPDDLDQDLKASETRSILVLARKGTEDNEFYKKIVNKGYTTSITNTLSDALKTLSGGGIKIVVLDASKLGKAGPEYVKRLNQEFPGTRIIVFNESNVNSEQMYRENHIFYYGVTPISNNELVDLLHCAFTSVKEKVSLKSPHTSRFLPNNISKISMTNRYGIKVTLLAYNEILQHNSGLGFLLTKELLDRAFPVEIHHSRFHNSIDDVSEIQHIAAEKENNERIIILQSKEMNKIPGSITKEIQEYTNKDASLNLLISISIQPAGGKSGNFGFDEHTTMALKELIVNEMSLK